jgi:hypothetical protein
MRLEDIRTLSKRAQEFERLLHDLFIRERFEVTARPMHKVQGARIFAADFLIKAENGNTAIVEAKLFSSRSMPPSVILSTVNQLESDRRLFDARRGILATAIQISHEAKDRFRLLHPALLIYDLNALVFLFTKYYDLQKRFEALTRAALTFSDVPEPNPENVDIHADLQKPVAKEISSPPPEPDEPKGQKLCDEIKTIQARKDQAKAFERKMTEALQYLFENDLAAWSPQRSSDSGISLYDLVARVNSTHDFWKALVNHFYSRYVVFEFKNYGGKIKQGQIHTTEKYLYRTALRSTAIIISRKGADKNALAVCRGALREQGKLIINLTTDDICKMLHLRDEPGGDCNSVLTEYVDGMLMRLER